MSGVSENARPRLFLVVPILAAAVPVVALAVLYGASEWRLRQFTTPATYSHEIRADFATRSAGERIARTRGCYSCHGANLEGKDWSAEWTRMGRVIAVNLARYAREDPPEVLERAIRHGIGRDGRALYSMPSYNFRYLSDEDLGALITYLRQHPVFPDTLGVPYHSLEVRWALAFGDEVQAAELVTEVPPLLTSATVDGPEIAGGEYLAMTACNECHGFDLRGGGPVEERTPDLAIVAAYTREEFGTLLRTGVSRDGRSELRLMSRTARNRFVHFTEQEVDRLYAFLRTLAARPIAVNVPWRWGD